MNTSGSNADAESNVVQFSQAEPQEPEHPIRAGTRVHEPQKDNLFLQLYGKDIDDGAGLSATAS